MDSLNNKTIKLFFVKTGLERVMTDIIAKPYCNDHRCFLFAYRPDLLNSFLWNGWFDSAYLNPKEKKGVFATRRMANSHLETIYQRIEESCVDAEVIEIHLSILKSSKNNFVINYLRRCFPDSEVVVNIIPHGTANFHRPEISKSEHANMQRKNSWFLRLLFPKLEYYVYSGERYGADDPIVRTIYTFPGQRIKSAKAKEIEVDHFVEQKSETTSKEDILILGQPVYKKERLTPENVDIISHRISELITELGHGKVYFLPHPLEDGSKCFYDEEYEWMEPGGPMELLLFKRNFKTIISSFSTGLFTSRLILGDQCQVYAVGMNLVNAQEGEIEELYKEFESVGVTIIDID